MSVESATQFLNELSNDPALRVKLQSEGTLTAQAIMDFALIKGYVFTQDELKTALAKYPGNPTVEQLRDRLRVKAAV